MFRQASKAVANTPQRHHVGLYMLTLCCTFVITNLQVAANRISSGDIWLIGKAKYIPCSAKRKSIPYVQSTFPGKPLRGFVLNTFLNRNVFERCFVSNICCLLRYNVFVCITKETLRPGCRCCNICSPGLIKCIGNLGTFHVVFCVLSDSRNNGSSSFDLAAKVDAIWRNSGETLQISNGSRPPRHLSLG